MQTLIHNCSYNMMEGVLGWKKSPRFFPCSLLSLFCGQWCKHNISELDFMFVSLRGLRVCWEEQMEMSSWVTLTVLLVCYRGHDKIPDRNWVAYYFLIVLETIRPKCLLVSLGILWSPVGFLLRLAHGLADDCSFALSHVSICLWCLPVFIFSFHESTSQIKVFLKDLILFESHL